jgi:hypothetical protein
MTTKQNSKDGKRDNVKTAVKPLKADKAGGGSQEQGADSQGNTSSHIGQTPSSDHVAGGHPLTKQD